MRSIMALGKSAGSSSFCMSTDVPHRSYYPARMWQHGWDPSVSPGTRCLWWIVWSWLEAWEENWLQVACGLQKGGHAGSRRRAVIGLDLRLGPTQKKWTRMQLGCATKLRSLMGKATHLCRVYQIVACHSLFRETKGRCECGKKGALPKL
jgi:hypothetical protein